MRLLNPFNGRIGNFSRQIDRFPDERELSEKLLADICQPRQERNEKIVLKIESVYLQQPELVRNYFDISGSSIFKDCIEDVITNTNDGRDDVSTPNAHANSYPRRYGNCSGTSWWE